MASGPVHSVCVVTGPAASFCCFRDGGELFWTSVPGGAAWLFVDGSTDYAGGGGLERGMVRRGKAHAAPAGEFCAVAGLFSGLLLFLPGLDRGTGGGLPGTGTALSGSMESLFHDFFPNQEDTPGNRRLAAGSLGAAAGCGGGAAANPLRPVAETVCDAASADGGADSGDDSGADAGLAGTGLPVCRRPVGAASGLPQGISGGACAGAGGSAGGTAASDGPGVFGSGLLGVSVP